MSQPPLLSNYIGGRWVSSTGTEQLDVFNPATGQVIARTPLSTRKDVDCAVQAGLDADAARRVVRGDDYAAEVRTAVAHWQRLGIHAVPSVVIDERHLIQGGQPPEVFEQALRQLAAGADD